MAKKIKLADLVFKVGDDNTLKVFASNAKKAGKELKNVEKAQDETTYATKKGINQTANQTKNFANLARGISGSLVPAYATLAANVFALTAVFGFLRQAADYRVLQQGQAAYASVTGVAYKTLTNTIVEATDAQIRYTDAAQAAAIGTAAGLTPEQLGKLAEAAKTVSIALGRDVTDSFNRLIRGTTKAEPELLDELGIVLRLETATKNYAAQLGVAKESLNAFQRTQAVTADVLGQVETKFAAINAIIDPETNKINKLTKAFDDLMNNLRSFIAGPAEDLAVFFSENLGAAIGALGLFVLPILQGILPAFDEMAANAEKNLARHNQAVEQAKTALNAYKDTSKQAAAQAQRTFSSLQKKAQDQAGAAGLPQGRTGSGMRALQEGRAITTRQAAAIKKQINDRNSAYFVANNRLRKQWTKTLDKMVQAHKVATGRIKVEAKGLELFFKKTGAQILVGWKATMRGMSAAAAKAGKVINKAFAFFTYASIALLAFEGIKTGLEKFGLLKGSVDTANTALGKLVRTQKDLNRELQEMLNADMTLAAQDLNLTMSQMIKRQGDRLTSAALGPTLSVLRANREQRANLETQRANIPKQQSLDEYMVIQDVYTRDNEKKVNALTTEIDALAQSEKELLEGEDGLIKRIEILSKTFPQFSGLIKDGKLVNDDLTESQYKLIDAYTSGAAAVKSLEQSEASYQQALQSRFGKTTSERATLKMARERVAEMNLAMKSPEFMAKVDDPSKEAEVSAMYAKRARAQKVAAAMGASDIGQRAAVVDQQRIALQQQALKNSIAGATILGQKRKVLLDINQKQAQIDSLRVQIAERRALLDQAEDKEAAQRAIQDLEHNVTLLQSQKKGLENSINLTRELGVVATEAFANSMQKGIQGVIEGTMSIKDAFKSMAQSILQSLAQVLAKMMTMKILSSMFGIPGVPMANGGIIPMAKGGIIKGYQHGGIAREPTYLVGEAGPEAVVPLPDGRSIPVNMSGATGNNITINVDASGQSTTTMDGERGKALGVAIQAAVMETIQREKRPGGVLSGN
jgi:hypothetical protein